VRLRLDLAYDGTAYAGWAMQPGLATVEGAVTAALATVLRLDEPARLTVAGRTDAGVHARGQVAHVDVPAVDPSVVDTLSRRLDGVLPLDIRMHRVTVAPVGFDARFSALSRRYAYRVTDGPVDPLRRRDTLGYPRPLDLDAMNEAASGLLGEHDFAAYCKPRDGGSTVRRLLRFSWRRDDDGVAVASVEADAFCHSMVRALVGAALTVGAGRRPVTWPAEVLAARRRDPAVTVVSPHGLTLEEVVYPPDKELAARAEVTRRFRG